MSSWHVRSSSSLWLTSTFRMFFHTLNYGNILTPTRETKRKTLEEVAAAFGDRVVLADDVPKGESVVGKVDHVESANSKALSA